MKSLQLGDCIELLQKLDANSIDVGICDPPYGLEFMGKEWDTFKETGNSSTMHSVQEDSEFLPAWGTPVKYRPRFPKKGQKIEIPDMPGEGGDITFANSTYAKKGFKVLPVFRYSSKELRQEALIQYQAWTTMWAREVSRVLKPGGYLLAMGAPRTEHRLTSGIEDAGFEIRDKLYWNYHNGFPKGLDISKAFDRRAGAEREVIGENPNKRVNKESHESQIYHERFLNAVENYQPLTKPATDLAKQWAGWNTAIKPAAEPIVVARKPPEGTMTENIEKYGVGAFNIDDCRIPFENDPWIVPEKPRSNLGHKLTEGNEEREGPHEQGRWPSNIVRLEPFGDELDKYYVIPEHYPFIPVPKPTPSGKGDGCGNMYWQTRPELKLITREEYDRLEPKDRGEGNIHPTVKPVDLFIHLIRLVTQEGATVLDPFLGSGTTAVAAKVTGRKYIGMEQSVEYLKIARVRIKATKKKPSLLGFE